MKKEIGKNVSSGAKKVERVEKETAYEAEKTEEKKPVKKSVSKTKSV